MRVLLYFVAGLLACACDRPTQSISNVLEIGSNDDRKTLMILKELSEAEQYYVGNGYTNVVKYNVSTFNVKKHIDERITEWRDIHRSCSYKITVGRTDNVALLHKIKEERLEEMESPEVLEKLHQKGKLKNIISISWDGKRGDSESCSIWFFDVFAVDGEQLILEYELTD